MFLQLAVRSMYLLKYRQYFFSASSSSLLTLVLLRQQLLTVLLVRSQVLMYMRQTMQYLLPTVLMITGHLQLQLIQLLHSQSRSSRLKLIVQRRDLQMQLRVFMFTALRLLDLKRSQHYSATYKIRL